MPVITIIIPYYNTPVDSFNKCINSLNALVLKDYFEVLIIDDGSTIPLDLTQYNPSFAWNIIRQEENKGPGAARQLGIVHSTTEYIMFLDADDWFLHTHALDEYKQKIERFYPDVLEPELAYLTPGGTSGHTTEAIWGCCYRKEFLVQNNIGFVELYYSEDFLFKTLVEWHSPIKISIEDVSYGRGTLNTASLTRADLSMAYFCEAAAIIYAVDFFTYYNLDISKVESVFIRAIKNIMNNNSGDEYYLFNIAALVYVVSCVQHKIPNVCTIVPIVKEQFHISLLRELCTMVMQADAESQDANPKMTEHITYAFDRAEQIYMEHNGHE